MLVMRGRERGTMVVTRSIANGRLTIVTVTKAPGISFDVRREIVADVASLAPISLAARETYRGFTAETRLAVDGDRMKGVAEEHGETGTRRTLVDVALAGAVDTETLPTLVATLDLSEGFKTTIPTFVSFPGAITAMSIAVVGRERVQVAGRTVDGWVVTLARPGAPPSTIVVDSAAHRVVSIRDSNSDFRLVR